MRHKGQVRQESAVFGAASVVPESRLFEVRFAGKAEIIARVRASSFSDAAERGRTLMENLQAKIYRRPPLQGDSVGARLITYVRDLTLLTYANVNADDDKSKPSPARKGRRRSAR